MKFFGSLFGGGDKSPELTERGKELVQKQKIMDRLREVNALLTRGAGVTTEHRIALTKEKGELEKELGIMPAPTDKGEPVLNPLTQTASETVGDDFKAMATEGNNRVEARLLNESTPEASGPADTFKDTPMAAPGGITEKDLSGIQTNPTDNTDKIEPQIPASLLKENNPDEALPTPPPTGETTMSVDTPKDVSNNTTTQPEIAPASEESGKPPADGQKITLRYSLGGKDQTFVVGEENQVPNLKPLPLYTSVSSFSPDILKPSKIPEKEVRPQQKAPPSPVANTPETTPASTLNPIQEKESHAQTIGERHNSDNERGEEPVSWEQKRQNHVSRLTQKGYPAEIFENCQNEKEIIHAMGGYMKEKYYELGYPRDLFTTCNTPIEVKNAALAYRENLIHERALEEQNRLARAPSLRAGEESPTGTGTQEVRGPLVTPEALAKEERIATVRDAQERRVSSRRIPGGWWSRNKEKVAGTAGILGGALAIAALTFTLFGKTAVPPGGGESSVAATAPIAAAIQDCQKQKEIQVVKKKIAQVTAPHAEKQTAATVSLRNTPQTESVKKEESATQASPEVTVTPSEPIVTAVPSTPPSAPQGFPVVLPERISMPSASASERNNTTVIIQQKTWNPAGFGAYYPPTTIGDWLWRGERSRNIGGVQPGTIKTPGAITLPQGAPPRGEYKPPVPTPIPGSTGGVVVPPPVGGPSVGGPSIGAPIIGAPISGGVNGLRPNTSAPTVNAPIMGGGYSGGVPNIGGPSTGGSFGNTVPPIVRPPTVNAPISNGSYSNNSSYSSGGSFVGGPSFGGSNGSGNTPIVGAPNLGRPVSGGAPVINTQTGGSSQLPASGPRPRTQ